MCRDAEGSGVQREHIAVAATFTAEPLAPYLGSRLVTDPLTPPLLTIAPYNQLFQVCYSWREMFRDRMPTAIVLLWRIEDLVRPDFQAVMRGQSIEPLLEKVHELAGAVAALRKDFPGAIISSTPPFPHAADHDIRALGNASTAGCLHRKVAEIWNHRDDLGLMEQIGAPVFAGAPADQS